MIVYHLMIIWSIILTLGIGLATARGLEEWLGLRHRIMIDPHSIVQSTCSNQDRKHVRVEIWVRKSGTFVETCHNPPGISGPRYWSLRLIAQLTEEKAFVILEQILWR